jgi:hypothetical protein
MAAAPLRLTLLAALLATCAARSPADWLLSALRVRGATPVASDADSSDAHEVLRVPGYEGALPSRHYAGYITVDADHGREARGSCFCA